MGNLRSVPWNGTTLGDAGPYSAGEWQQFWESMLSTGRSDHGILSMYFEGFRPVYNPTTPNNNISIYRGAALVNGVLVAQDTLAATVMTFAANSSGFSRIDRVVLEANYVTQEANLIIVQGTPGASPAIPALTQNSATKWQIPVCYVTLVNGYTSVDENDITDERVFIDQPEGIQFFLQNRDGTTVSSGMGATVGPNTESFTRASRNATNNLGVIKGAYDNLTSGFMGGGHTRIRGDGSVFAIGGYATISNATLGTYTPYTPASDYANASVMTAMTLEVSSARYVPAMVFPRLLNFNRFQYYTNTGTQLTGSNTTLARVGTGTQWECIINVRAAPVLVHMWFVCRNDTGGFGAVFRIYNNTQSQYVSTVFDNALVGTTWFLISIWGIDFAYAAGSNTYHLHGMAGGGGNWVTRGGSMWAMELAS